MKAIASIIVIIIIIVIWKASERKKTKEDFISGFWTGDQEFLKRSKLKDFHMYVAPTKNASGSLKVFLVITDENGDFISNQIAQMDTGGLSNSVYLNYTDPAFNAIPNYCKMDIDVNKGTMMLYDDGKVYGFLIKNNQISLSANETYLESTPIE